MKDFGLINYCSLLYGQGVRKVKKYVFINYAISAIGGAQIYLYNKVKYCEKNGWDVYVFSGLQGEIHIEKLRKYKKLINRNLNEYPYLYSKRKIKKLVKWMLCCIGYNDGDEVLIECGGVAQALWGELLAKECRGKNIAYILSEKLSISNKSVYDFLEFKWQRKEFRCINAKIMQNFFYDKNITEEQCYVFRAPCTNSMEDIEIPINLDFKPNEPIIGIIGRLSKDYVYASLAEIIKFAQKHPDKFYNVLIVGGGKKVYYNQIKKLIKNIKNLKVIITGRLYPIPQKMIEMINIAIGSSGSIRLPWSLNIPSISVDLNNNKAIGFLGYDTQNTQFATANEKLKNISDCLDDFFYNSYIEKYDGAYISTNLRSAKEISEILDTHFEFVQLADSKKEYFNKFVIDEFKYRLIKLAYYFGGYRMICTLKRIKMFLHVI